MVKKLMQYKYLSPIKLLIIYGMIGTIITVLIGIISSFNECNNIYLYLDLKICKIKDNNNTTYLENFKIWWKNETKIDKILLLLIGIIMNFFIGYFIF